MDALPLLGTAFIWTASLWGMAVWGYKQGRASVREEAETQRKFLAQVTETMCKDRGCWVKSQVDGFNGRAQDASGLDT